jgi:signal transduction histidine kinase
MSLTSYRVRQVDTIAHELRNPLASLRLSLDMLVQDFDQLDTQAALHLVRRAHRSASWLETLTEHLTSASSIESGKLEIQLDRVDLVECMDEAALLVQGLLDQRQQRVRLVVNTTAACAIADRARVIQIIANLLSNASRYSVEGDEIELHVATIGQDAWVQVIDHGPGISPEDQERIFGAWVRLDGSRPGGMGLGLSIVQGLVQQQGGRLGVESMLGQGATFWFTLPAASAADSEAGVTCRH